MTKELKKKDCKNQTGAIWRFHGNIYKAHCTDPALAKRIGSWAGCEFSSVYHYPDGHREMDVLFPERLYNRVAELLGLPLRRKSSGRVFQGQRMSVINKKHRFLRKTKSQKSPSERLSGARKARESNTLAYAKKSKI